MTMGGIGVTYERRYIRLALKDAPLKRSKLAGAVIFSGNKAPPDNFKPRSLWQAAGIWICENDYAVIIRPCISALGSAEIMVDVQEVVNVRDRDQHSLIRR
jgi:hypothetical protein